MVETMQKPSDPTQSPGVFIDLNAAWMKNHDALAVNCQELNQAMHRATQKVYDHMQVALAETPPSAGEALLQWVQKLAWSSRQYHQVLSDWLISHVEQAPDLTPATRRQARFWVRQINEMIAPSNFFWTNPQAVQRFVRSDGRSLFNGWHNWMIDLQRGDGLLRLTDQESFSVGHNLATTPGQVVYRNALVEVIQYAPQTERVHQVPVVLIQPWINKYYIFDLTAQNSLIRYLVCKGFTVFVTSWKNPDADMRHITFEDYMCNGALATIQVARTICRSPKVHAAGYCIGGTLLAALMGWLAHDEHQPVADVTLFATMLDFSQPGDLGCFLTPDTLSAIEQAVAAKGVLKDNLMALTFRMLNPGELIWRYVVNNYFYGEPPPRSEILFWNSDSTRLPEAMCNFYLKSFYIENRMATPNALKVTQRPIDLKQVRQPHYLVGAAKDHICPWQATFQTCRLVSGPVRYILADEGHITGFVNPPSPWSKKKYWAGAASRRRDHSKWLQRQTPSKGSWWPDWVAWLTPRSGSKVPPPSMGCKAHPALAPAPGTYVLEP